MERRVCAFTGHRPGRFAFGYEQEHPDCTRLKNAIGKTIATLARKGVTTFISGMAQGVDLWAAREVLRQKGEYPALRLIAVQPCADQPQRWPACGPTGNIRIFWPAVMSGFVCTIIIRPIA